MTPEFKSEEQATYPALSLKYPVSMTPVLRFEVNHANDHTNLHIIKGDTTATTQRYMKYVSESQVTHCRSAVGP